MNSNKSSEVSFFDFLKAADNFSRTLPFSSPPPIVSSFIVSLSFGGGRGSCFGGVGINTAAYVSYCTFTVGLND
jgi:hypothetical protein